MAENLPNRVGAEPWRQALGLTPTAAALAGVPDEFSRAWEQGIRNPDFNAYADLLVRTGATQDSQTTAATHLREAFDQFQSLAGQNGPATVVEGMLNHPEGIAPDFHPVALAGALSTYSAQEGFRFCQGPLRELDPDGTRVVDLPVAVLAAKRPALTDVSPVSGAVGARIGPHELHAVIPEPKGNQRPPLGVLGMVDAYRMSIRRNREPLPPLQPLQEAVAYASGGPAIVVLQGNDVFTTDTAGLKLGSVVRAIRSQALWGAAAGQTSAVPTDGWMLTGDRNQWVNVYNGVNTALTAEQKWDVVSRKGRWAWPTARDSGASGIAVPRTGNGNIDEQLQSIGSQLGIEVQFFDPGSPGKTQPVTRSALPAGITARNRGLTTRPEAGGTAVST